MFLAKKRNENKKIKVGKLIIHELSQCSNNKRRILNQIFKTDHLKDKNWKINYTR